MKDGVPKISDFGLSCYSLDTTSLSTNCGTRRFKPPESAYIKDGVILSDATDYYALGVLLFLMLYRRFPTFRFDLAAVGPVPQFPVFSTVTRKAKRMLRGLMHPNPGNRSDYRTVMDHDWMKDNESAASGKRWKRFFKRPD